MLDKHCPQQLSSWVENSHAVTMSANLDQDWPFQAEACSHWELCKGARTEWLCSIKVAVPQELCTDTRVLDTLSQNHLLCLVPDFMASVWRVDRRYQYPAIRWRTQQVNICSLRVLSYWKAKSVFTWWGVRRLERIGSFKTWLGCVVVPKPSSSLCSDSHHRLEVISGISSTRPSQGW